MCFGLKTSTDSAHPSARKLAKWRTVLRSLLPLKHRAHRWLEAGPISSTSAPAAASGGMGYCRFGVQEFTAIGKAVFGNINNTEYVRSIYVRTGRGHVAPNRRCLRFRTSELTTGPTHFREGEAPAPGVLSVSLRSGGVPFSKPVISSPVSVSYSSKPLAMCADHPFFLADGFGLFIAFFHQTPHFGVDFALGFFRHILLARDRMAQKYFRSFSP